MALPVKKAADLAADMAKKGIGGSIAMGPDPDAPSSDGGGGDDEAAIKADLAKAVPGCDPDMLFSLISEICERSQGQYDGGDEGGGG